MNKDARHNIHVACETLETAYRSIKGASQTGTDSQVQSRIKDQTIEIEKCLKECKDIASGISQHKFYD
ncbi:MAG: hypothetical protein Q8936_17775 [Bacillota bacterium]|nr:hypothetical protein [Bacillota bacterium]